MRILAIDTATEACSVALADGDGTPLRVRECVPGKGASELILPLVREVLAEAGIGLADLSAIAFGRGPGGFTGVRLAASVAQGLAFGAGVPVIPVSDLHAVAQQVFDTTPARAVLVCNDARMKEVYWTVCGRDDRGLAREAAPERVGPPDAVQLPPGLDGPVFGAGRGFAVYPQLAQRLRPALAGVLPDALPRAREILRLARVKLSAGQALPPQQALPVYLRDDVAKPSRN